MSRSLSRREIWLAGLVGVAGLAFGVLIFGDWYFHSRQRLVQEISTKDKQLHRMQALASQQQFWEDRDAWLRANQPPATADDTAGVQLMEEVKALARKHGLVYENQTIRPPEPQSTGVAVAVEMEVKSAWGPLVSFLYELQSPERFIAVDNANLRVDSEDQARLRGRLRIARWLSTP